MIILAAALTVSGCGIIRDEPQKNADNTAALCTRWKDSTRAFVGTEDENLAPETQAYRKALEDEYVGKQHPKPELIEIQRAYWSAQEAMPRTLAAEATNSKLSDAFSAYADELRGRAAGQIPVTGDAMGSQALKTLMSFCWPGPSTAPGQ
ncbi:hypothetical protein ACIBSW_39665 [Actinoplanes sp. NPDC049668]|uniref:hypothetical protein n=1 Tax=unclassified Actinoplanes TaxID=2626549 RepID=UPI0033A253B5